jgi:hypothetical protein
MAIFQCRLPRRAPKYNMPLALAGQKPDDPVDLLLIHRHVLVLHWDSSFSPGFKENAALNTPCHFFGLLRFPGSPGCVLPISTRRIE